MPIPDNPEHDKSQEPEAAGDREQRYEQTPLMVDLIRAITPDADRSRHR